MSAAGLLQELRMRGIELRAEGDRLLYRSPAAVSGELLGRLRASKSQILAELEQEEAIPILETRVLFRSKLGIEVLEVRPVDPPGPPRWEKRLQRGRHVALVAEVTSSEALMKVWIVGLKAWDERADSEDESA